MCDKNLNIFDASSGVQMLYKWILVIPYLGPSSDPTAYKLARGFEVLKQRLKPVRSGDQRYQSLSRNIAITELFSIA